MRRLELKGNTPTSSLSDKDNRFAELYGASTGNMKATELRQAGEPGYRVYLPGQDPDFTWRTNDGRGIKIYDMTEEHLRNAISWAQRQLVRQFGAVTWLEQLQPMVHALNQFMLEAKRRGFKF
jgi:hypothetical protein